MKLFYRKPRLGRSSVKEGLDNLPSGICFADSNGVIVLCNRQMHRLCRVLMGTDLQHIFELRRALRTPQPAVRAEDGSAMIYRFPDGRLWQFTETAVTDAEGIAYTQMQAIDVTELHERRAELERENLALTAANNRAKKLYAEMDRIVREKETLAMKMRLHDDLGQCLLATRNLLTRDSSLEEYRKGGKRWAQALRLIALADRGEASEPPLSGADALAELIASAADIGVCVRVAGELPPSGGNAYLFVVALRECVTNTVRHAEGDTVSAVLTAAQNADIAVITNNGKPPAGEIVEGGGLSGLRHSIEAMGGRMTVESLPAFRLTVTLPREESKQW